jgi:hypothetical protein
MPPHVALYGIIIQNFVAGCGDDEVSRTSLQSPIISSYKTTIGFGYDVDREWSLE